MLAFLFIWFGDYMRFEYVIQVLGSRGNYLSAVKFENEQAARDFIKKYLKDKPPNYWRLMKKEINLLPT
mgnify:CR=1 FL=1